MKCDTHKDEFAVRLRDFVAEKASPRSLEFDSSEFDEFVVPFMKKQFENRFFTKASRMSKEERGMVTLIEHPALKVRLLRYHLGWSPGKIVKELNQFGFRNHRLPWRESDVRKALKGIRRVF